MRCDEQGFLLIAQKYDRWVPINTIATAYDLLCAIALHDGNAWVIGDLDGKTPIRFWYEGQVDYNVAEMHYDPDWLPGRLKDIEAHLFAAFKPFLAAEALHSSFVRIRRVRNRNGGRAGYFVHVWLTIRNEFAKALRLRLSRGIETARGHVDSHSITEPALHAYLD